MGRNVPSGARCFLAAAGSLHVADSAIVVMHLLALGAFWLMYPCGGRVVGLVVMHLLALGAFWPYAYVEPRRQAGVVMHLLALGAFWPNKTSGGTGTGVRS